MYMQLIHPLKRLLLVIAGMVILYFSLKYMILFFYPFLIAMTISYMMNPFVTYLENTIKIPRTISTILSISIFLIIILFISSLLFTEFIQGTTYLAEQIPAYFQDFIVFIESLISNKIIPLYHKLTSFLQTLNPSQQITTNEYLNQFTSQIAKTGTTFLRNVLLKIPAILSLLPQSITMFIFIILATFFMTNDWNKLKTVLSNFLPVSLNRTGKTMLVQIEKSLLGFIKAQFILVLTSAVIIIIGLLFLQIDHALTIALLIAVVDLLPLIGTGIVFIPWIIFLFLNANYSLTIGLTILYMIVVVSRQILEPKILSTAIGINPLVALLILFISIQLWGPLPGIIIAPFFLVLTSALYQVGVPLSVWNYIKGKT